MNEYEPSIDSAHDMIFGNVMGMDYGNYVHGPLWNGPQQGCGRGRHPDAGQPHMCTAPPSLCCQGKPPVHGYNQPMPNPQQHRPLPFYDSNGNLCENENLPPPPSWIQPYHAGRYGGAPQGVGRRSYSVPGPRTVGPKETMKQAAIRCGIIKANHTVASIPHRSQVCSPIQQLTPVQSDPAVPVVEILQPKLTLDSCSSDTLVELEDFSLKTPHPEGAESDDIILHKSVPALNIATVNSASETTQIEISKTEEDLSGK